MTYEKTAVYADLVEKIVDTETAIAVLRAAKNALAQARNEAPGKRAKAAFDAAAEILAAEIKAAQADQRAVYAEIDKRDKNN